MSISQISSYAPSDNDPTNLMQTTDDMRVGLHELTITEYTTNTVPAIAVGSVIEVNGTLFKGGSETAISGSPSNGTVYVSMVPSGSSPSQILTPTFTNTAPTWFDSKQGWYDATGTYRYIHFAMTKSGSSYTPKWEFLGRSLAARIDSNGYFRNNVIGDLIGGITETGAAGSVLKIKILEIGDWDMDATGTLNVAHGLTWTNIRRVSAIVRNDADTGRTELAGESTSSGYGGISFTSTVIALHRTTGGTFDNINYDSTSYNRGWIYIDYIA